MRMYTFFLSIILLIASMAFTACGSDGGGSIIPITFDTAKTPGDTVSITVGSESVDMIYANNQTSITFPFNSVPGYSLDNDKGTITRKFFMSKTEVTNALMVEVLQWAYDNGKFFSSFFVRYD